MCHNMAIKFIRSFVITMKHFTKQNCPPMQLAWNIGIQINNTVNTSNEKNFKQFLSKKKYPSPQNIVPHLMFIIWNFIAINLYRF